MATLMQEAPALRSNGATAPDRRILPDPTNQRSL
jgi:hypothetical protein